MSGVCAVYWPIRRGADTGGDGETSDESGKPQSLPVCPPLQLRYLLDVEVVYTTVRLLDNAECGTATLELAIRKKRGFTGGSSSSQHDAPVVHHV